jgi:uncharacterized protein YbjT (DUF2867 family)
MREAGHHVRIMSRHSAPGNLLPETEWVQAHLQTGEGIAAAVQGIDVIVHAASSPSWHTQQVDVDGTRRLLEHAHAAAVAHMVYISIVGIDRIPFGYYQCKRVTEDLIQQSGIPWSLLRATQFHYLIDFVLRAATKLPLVTPLPTNLHFQSVAESEVAQRLREIVQSGPGGRWPDMGGPEVQTLGELAQNWLSLRGMRRAVIPLWLLGKSAQGFRRGDNTCPEQAVGKITWAEWVGQKYQRQ